MKSLRITSTLMILSILILLALLTDNFWWFQEVKDWQIAFDDWGGGKEQMTTACLWATVHGALSIIIGTIFCMINTKPFHSPKHYALYLLGYSLTSASFLAIADIGSGLWMLIEGGRYIPLCYTAFLQPFLVGYLLVILFVPNPVNKPPRQLTLPFKTKSCC